MTTLTFCFLSGDMPRKLLTDPGDEGILPFDAPGRFWEYGKWPWRHVMAMKEAWKELR